MAHLPIHYLALHEIFPDFGPVGNAVIVATVLSGFVGAFVFLPSLWLIRRRSGSTRRRPPVRLLLLAGFMVAWMPFVLIGERGIVLLEWIFGALWCAGNGTMLWWLWDRISPRRPLYEDPAPLVVAPPDLEVRSMRDACEACQASASSGGGPPLSRIAHNADGPRFLYRCAECHSYWEKDVKGMRPISVLRVRHDFPAVVI